MEKMSYTLETFEGPLDLLLSLISKNKLDIKNIMISDILDQYLDHIAKMDELNMDISSDFLEMAARLIYIKTVSLLPKQEETEKLKKELTGQLIEYQLCKNIAKIMMTMINFDSFSRDKEELNFDTTYDKSHNTQELINALRGINQSKLKKNKVVDEENFSEIVSKKMVSVTSKIVYLLRRLWKHKVVDYLSIFNDSKNKSDMVALFLAVLELSRSKRIGISTETDGIKIFLVKGKLTGRG